jgi:crossover junction endodeoxyribonuclease RuvC
MEMASSMQFKEHGIVAAVEKVGAMPGQGVTSMFHFGKSAGYIEGVLTALGIPYQLVPPVKWKRAFSLVGKDKKASIETCRKLFPELDLKRTERCRTDSDGKAESALLACYAMRHFREGSV